MASGKLSVNCSSVPTTHCAPTLFKFTCSLYVPLQRSMAVPSAPLDIEAQSHQVSERPVALGVRQPTSIRAGPPEANPNTREALFVDTCPETCLQMVFRYRP
jgi:hypothetical protein